MPFLTNFNTAARCVELAMANAKKLREGDLPTPEQYATNIGRLTDMINHWQTKGLKLWLNQDISIPLVAGTSEYKVGPGQAVNMVKPLRVVHGGSYYLDSSSNRRPIWPISWDDYNRLSNVTTQGAINSYFVDKQRDFLRIRFWNTPDAEAATGTAHLLFQTQVTGPVSLTAQLDFPNEWFLALQWGLAQQICVGQPREIVEFCIAMARETLEDLENWDVEDAPTKIEPDPRMFETTRDFNYGN